MTDIADDSTVAVIIPYYKTIDLIARAVRSAAANKCVTEIIVADDGSEDDVAAVVMPIDDRVRCLSGVNAGAPNARNRGLRFASTKWVLFLDADDYLDPGYVDILVSTAGAADIVIGQHKQISTSGQIYATVGYKAGLSRTEILNQYLVLPVQTGASLWRRQYALRIGCWDESVIVFQDVEFMIRALLAGGAVSVADTNNLSAYWVDNDSANRVSKYSYEKALCVLRILTQYSVQITNINNGKPLNGLGVRLYSLARLAFSKGYRDVGQAALDKYYSLGFKGHLGSMSHRIMCHILGLDGKIRAANKLRSVMGKVSLKQEIG